MNRLPTAPGRRVAVLLGVNAYDEPAINPLIGAVTDAMKLGGLLSNLPQPFEVVLMQASPPTTKAELRRTVRRLCAGLKPGDELLLFFAGHGCQRRINGREEHLLLLPGSSLAELDYFDEAVPVSQLLAWTAVPGVRRLLILDACRNNLERSRSAMVEGFRGVGTLRNLVGAQPAETGGPLTLICACDEGKCAQESSDLGGLFTQAWLLELHGRLRTGQAAPVDSELVGAVARRMDELAQRHGLEQNQRPWMTSTGEPIRLFGPADPSAHPAPAPGVTAGVSVHVQDLRELARLGDARAQTELAECHLEGRGTPRDEAAARSWYGQAANRGHAGAMYQLGSLLEQGRGGERDLTAALGWYRRAADLDQGHALLRLGELALLGSVPEGGDESAGFRLLERAAHRGPARAQYQLARLHLSGRGTAPDPERAEAWCRRAAEQGLPQACLLAGRLAERRLAAGGGGQAADVSRFYRAAAMAQLPSACRQLARWLRSQPGEAQGPGEAEKWLQQARLLDGGSTAVNPSDHLPA